MARPRRLRTAVQFGVLSAALIGLTWALGLPHRSVTDDALVDGPRGSSQAFMATAHAAAGGNSPPIADAGPDITASLGQTVILDGSGTIEPEGSRVGFLWSFVSLPDGSAAVFSDPSALQPSFTVDLAGDYIVQLIASEGPRSSAPDTVTISTANSAPVADAGHDQAVAVGETVTLVGSGSSDFDGDSLSYDWSLVSAPGGSAATLSDPTDSEPSFIADLAGTYVAELVVSDGSLQSTVAVVTVSTDGVPPVAEAGPNQRAAIGQVVSLDAGGTHDADGDEVAIDWSLIVRPAGSGAKLSTPAEDRPGMTVDQAGSYVLQLDAEDGVGASTPDTLVVTTGNTPPVADAGFDQSVSPGAVVQLDGGGSHDIDGDALTYRWSILSAPAGSTAALDDPGDPRPQFIADLAGHYIVQLLVDDGVRPSRPETVVIGTGNGRPIADAGADQTRVSGQVAQLDGSGSFDPDLDALIYDWAIVMAPNGSSATLDDPTAVSPSFMLDKNGVYVIQLIVRDGTRRGVPDAVTIVSSNSRPLADAGPDQGVPIGTQVQLDGSASSDSDNDPLIHSWALIYKPPGSAAALSDPAAVDPSFTADLAGIYVAQLIVGDGALDSEPDTVVVEIVNSLPVADAGPDQIVTAGDTVQLDGSASSDPDMDPLTFVWSLVSKPQDSASTLSDPTAVAPTFLADAPGSYSIELVVNDGLAGSPPDIVAITANPVTAVNVAPVLNPIGNQSVNLGTTLTLDLSATDANGDPLTYSAAPLPLPNGASLNGATGVFSFRPDASQVGDVALIFTVSDGLATDSESVLVTVVGAPPGGATALSARLLDATDAAIGNTTPIVGATVTLLDPATGTDVGVFATSDTNGDFLLSGVPSGGLVLDVDSTTAQSAPDGSDYASFREEITLIDGVTNVIERPVFLPRVDPAGVAFVDANSTTTTVVENPNLGVAMEIPPDTAFAEDGSEFSGEVSISEVPLEFAPMALPDTRQPAMLLSIQPTGVTFSQPLLITFPNSDGLPPGSEMDIYSLEPESGTFHVVGVGAVSADGSTIETISGGIVAASWHFPSPPDPNPDSSSNNDDFDPGPGRGAGSGPGPDPLDPNNDEPQPDPACGNTGSSTSFCTGNLSIAHSLPTHRSHGRNRGLTLVYNSTSADPQPIIVTDATIPVRSAVPETISTTLRVAGIDQAVELFTDTSGLSETVDETIHLAAQWDAAEFPTGAYPYRLLVRNNFARSRVGQAQIGQVLVNNEQDSPLGAGWTLSGLQHLHAQADGNVILTRGDGSLLRFAPMAGGPVGFNGPTEFGLLDKPQAFALDDLDNDGNLDMAVPVTATGKVFIFLGDGLGGFPTIREVVAATPSSGKNTVAVATADFNSDLIRDLVVVNQEASTLTVHLGTGGDFYQAPSTINIQRPQSVAVADFDQDGNDDITLGNRAFFGNSSVVVFYGDGAGGFPSGQSFFVGFGTVPMPTILGEDFNGDNLPDIVVAIGHPTNPTFSLLTNDGNGGFVRKDVGAGPMSPELGRWARRQEISTVTRSTTWSSRTATETSR